MCDDLDAPLSDPERLAACPHGLALAYRYYNGYLLLACRECRVQTIWSDDTYRRRTGQEPPPRDQPTPLAWPRTRWVPEPRHAPRECASMTEDGSAARSKEQHP